MRTAIKGQTILVEGNLIGVPFLTELPWQASTVTNGTLFGVMLEVFCRLPVGERQYDFPTLTKYPKPDIRNPSNLFNFHF
jgi:hypothetical protein